MKDQSFIILVAAIGMIACSVMAAFIFYYIGYFNCVEQRRNVMISGYISLLDASDMPKGEITKEWAIGLAKVLNESVMTTGSVIDAMKKYEPRLKFKKDTSRNLNHK